MTDLDVTLTLAEYIRRMNSADAAEWLPTPAETRVMWLDKRIVDMKQTNNDVFPIRLYFGNSYADVSPNVIVTVSLLTY